MARVSTFRLGFRFGACCVRISLLAALCAGLAAPSQGLAQTAKSTTSTADGGLADQEPPPRALRHSGAQVKQHMQRAQKFFQEQEFAKAAEELQQAYSLDPRPLYLFNIGQAYRRASLAKEALEWYQRFIREDPKNPLRGETEGYCNDMRTKVALASPRQRGAFSEGLRTQCGDPGAESASTSATQRRDSACADAR